MNIDLIKGSYSPNETLDLVTELVHVKIKYLENKIETSLSEEDIKMRENRIKEIQRDFYELKQSIVNEERAIRLKSTISLG